MKIIKYEDLRKTSREVHCPDKGFISFRYLLKSDKMGFTVTQTFIPKNSNPKVWHYKNHLEACLCISGKGTISELNTGRSFDVIPGTMYVLDKHDKHIFRTEEDTVLVCVFNPPLKGKEVHGKDGSYK
jgi:L-ectoine synthase